MVAVLAALPLAAEEGMWMPQQIPQLGDQLIEMGLELDPAQFADLTGFPMGAIVSTGGCSAAFVSPQALIATNHHCVYGSLQYNSSPERNLLRDGFLAKTMNDEIPAGPGSRIYVTTAIEDVTDAVLGSLESSLTDIERQNELDRREKNLVARCEEQGGVRCRVASFFEGTLYLQTTQLEIRDVRLVYAPAEGIGVFGGEIDNWMWPRHTGDFGFYRAYVGPDGKPADYSETNVPYEPEHFLRISTSDLDQGDLVLIAGYPGRTQRYQTASEVRENITFGFPTSIRHRKAVMNILETEGAKDEDVAIRNASRIRGLANYLKKYEGTLDAFRERGLLAERIAEEEQMERLLRDDPELHARYRAAVDELNDIFERQQSTRERDTVLYWLYYGSPMLSQANMLYRLSRERAKPDVDREAAYQEREWSKLSSQIDRYQRMIEPGSDRAVMKYLLEEAAALPPSQRIEAIDRALKATGKATIEAQIGAYLDKLYAGTKTADLDARKAMFNESTKELLARGDTMIDLAAALRVIGDQNLEQGKQDDGAMTRLRPIYIDALKRSRGGLLAPDANSTLRVTFGTVEGYEPRDAVSYKPFTTIEGLVAKHTGEEPFNSPERQLKLAAERRFGSYIDPDLETLPVNFLSTTDITNGNSGSSVLNARGELIGLAFDGNYEAMGSDYVVIPELSRTIAVDARYMLWVMDAVDGADRLLEEMGVPPQLND